MEDILTRFFENLIGRLSGPLHFRLYLQPLTALLFAARAGIRDAKAGRPAYLWAMFTSQANRGHLLHESWKDVGKVFIVATVIDLVYQLVTVQWIYPLETIVAAIVLAFVPYFVFRGLFNRLAHRIGLDAPHTEKHTPA